MDKVYPELVIRDAAGKIQSVRYDELASMLLNEIQKQKRINEAHAAASKTQTDKIDDLTRQVAQLSGLTQELAASLHQMRTNSALVAQR